MSGNYMNNKGHADSETVLSLLSWMCEKYQLAPLFVLRQHLLIMKSTVDEKHAVGIHLNLKFLLSYTAM